MAQTPTGTIAGYFEDHADAARAVDALRDAGFTNAHLGVAYRGEHSATGTTSHAVGEKAGEKVGGAWNKIKNFFEGKDTASDTRATSRNDLTDRETYTPGYVSSSSSYGVSDAGSSAYGTTDFQDSLSGLAVPEDRSRYLSHRFGNSEQGAVVTVTAPDRESEAESLLREYGADLGDQAATYDYSSTSTGTTTEGAQNIQLLGEVLRVHKDRVSTGDVRFRKEVITDMQTVQVPVTREELVIERHAVSGDEAARGSIGDSGEIRIPLSEERASLDKSTVVREEVSVGKRNVEDVRELKGDVRHEDLVVDDETQTGKNRVA